MAWVTCPDCRLRYDDTYRFTFCPHEEFEMRSLAGRYVEGRYMELLCRSVEQLRAWERVEKVDEALAVGANFVEPGETLAQYAARRLGNDVAAQIDWDVVAPGAPGA
jgi:hypothetical protein